MNVTKPHIELKTRPQLPSELNKTYNHLANLIQAIVLGMCGKSLAPHGQGVSSPGTDKRIGMAPYNLTPRRSKRILHRTDVEKGAYEHLKAGTACACW